MGDEEAKASVSRWASLKHTATKITGHVQDKTPDVIARTFRVTKNASNSKLARSAAVGGAAGAAIGFVLPLVTVGGMALLGAAAVVLAKEIRGG